MAVSFRLSHPTENLPALLWVVFTLAIVLILFCAAPTHSQTASEAAPTIEVQAFVA